MKKNIHIGKMLRRLMMEKGVTQVEIADKVSLSSQGVGQVLGKNTIQMELLERFMNALDVNIYEILAKTWKNKTYSYADNIGSNIEETATEYALPKPTPVHVPASSNVSLLINVDSNKRDEVLKLLLA